jgi:hypothetical protein
MRVRGLSSPSPQNHSRAPTHDGRLERPHGVKIDRRGPGRPHTSLPCPTKINYLMAINSVSGHQAIKLMESYRRS